MLTINISNKQKAVQQEIEKEWPFFPLTFESVSWKGFLNGAVVIGKYKHMI